jgi:CRISPR-associated endonuclease/helicase Cas3
MTAPDLTVSDFAAFFTAVHGVEPFPWQDRLLHQLAETGNWPDLLDLPTGAGKTAALDIALFHLALDADKAVKRHAPVRIAFLVDRRLIVDEAYNRALKLAAALARGATDASRPQALRSVAARLAMLAEDRERPLLVRRLRGGVPREDEWARTPVQPTILCSTVDQVGSRLLFRGYGVSNSMKPVHAGLLGSDCLILLDEAHLSRPFRQTLQAVGMYGLRETDLKHAAPVPLRVALLTATPGEHASSQFCLNRDDREHLILRQRLLTPKPAKLIEVGGKPGQSSEDQRVVAVADAVAAALDSLSAGGLETQPVIGIVVNRVMRARHIFGTLRDAYGPAGEGEIPRADVFLVIGPAREADHCTRDRALTPIKTGLEEARRQLSRPRIIVATQTIEAGADLDFDALITELAPLDALKQRFGRLNRGGRAFTAPAVILAHREDLRPGKDGDPVYGMAAAASWNALQKLASSRGGGAIVDFGATASDAAPSVGEILPKQMKTEGLLSSKPEAPVLMPAYVDLWSQTSPIPATDPDISLFLHGPNRSPATVQIVWRADLELDRPDFDPSMLLAAVPPKAAEAVEVSLAAARRWLRREAGADFADAPEGPAEDVLSGGGKPAFRWAGPESERTQTIFANDLRPNDLIVVAADYGGCDEFGWNPGSDKPVEDVADSAAEPYMARRFALRLTPGLVGAVMPTDAAPAASEREQASAFAENLVGLVADWRDGSGRRRESILVSDLSDADPPRCVAKALELLKSPRQRQLRAIFPYGEDAEGGPRGVVLLAPKGVSVALEEVTAAGAAATEDDWQGSLSGSAQTLADHSCEVERNVTEFCKTLGIVGKIAVDIALSAYLHDAGKADPRFQAMLYGGNQFSINESRILAKSLPGVGRDAATRAGLPRHWRHEALSVRIAREHPRFCEANDKELVLWLIGVHHGYGRPLFPHADPRDECDRDDLTNIEGERLRLEKGAGPQSLSFNFEGRDWTQIFKCLKRRYGVWELARFEAIVRLADHRASEAAGRSSEEGAI